jgi:hypothetical protein
MNEKDIAEYIKHRILQKKYGNNYKSDTINLMLSDGDDTAWYRGFDRGIESACSVIDTILDEYELGKVVTSEFVISSYPDPENCVICDTNDIIVLLEGHPFKIHGNNPDPDCIIIKCRSCGHQVRVSKNDGDSLMSLMYRAINEWNKRPKGDQTMESKTDKMNELKKVMKQRATDAMAAMDDDLICYGIQCNDCEYHSDTADEWGNNCRVTQVWDLISEIIKLSEIAPPQYAIVSKSERVFGPASKEACEYVANTLENVEIKKVRSA